ncbi:reverse transcriptase domain-containing protein, partial [Tanacetum coccineum]
VFRRLKQNRSPSPRLRPRKEGGVFNRQGRKEQGAYTRSDSHHQSSQAKRTKAPARKHHHEGTLSRRTSGYSKSEDSEGGHWKSKSKRHRSDTYEDDLSQPWTCEERNPFTTRIQHFDFPRTRMPSHVKTYEGSGDPKDHIIVYLVAAKEAISAVLMTDKEGKQVPVYFVSHALRGPEINYTPMEKLVLALLSANKRLKRYFQAHTIVVIMDQPIKQLLSSLEISGRMLKWKFELEGYDIQYMPRTSIKGQILADFIVERSEEESLDEPMTEPEEIQEP